MCKKYQIKTDYNSFGEQGDNGIYPTDLDDCGIINLRWYFINHEYFY